jgi:hypothetical protein
MDWRWIHLGVLIAAICILLALAVPAGEPEPNFIVIDDFESYTDDENALRIYEVWIDGYINGTGSLVGYLNTGYHPNVVHGGWQAMPLEYNNVGAPYYSRVYRTWDVPQDWTVGHVADLSLWVHGWPVPFQEKPGGQILLSGSGWDADTGEGFRYAYKELRGDGEIVARVNSFDSPAGWAGVMVRETAEPSSYPPAVKCVAVVVTPGEGASFLYCRAADEQKERHSVPGVQAPCWVKLVRRGDTFTAQFSTDGTAWQDVTDSGGMALAVRVPMVVPAYVGLCVTSDRWSTPGIAEFSRVSLVGSSSAPWQVTRINMEDSDDLSNAPAALYVALEDATGWKAVALHRDAVNANEWVQWRIPLSEFSDWGVNLKAIKTMYIDIGDQSCPQPDGRGRIYLDDICLLPRAQAVALSPADGDANVSPTPVLKWSPGGRATHHDIYFGTDPNAVANATPATAGIYRGRQVRTDTTYEPGELEWNRTYWWRVDEVNDAHPESPWKGPVWRFTTADFLVIDDFEVYDHAEGTGTRVCESWINYWDAEPSTPVAFPCENPSLERKEMHGGRQAMALDYNNVPRLWLSAVERDWWVEEKKPLDFTVNGGDTLVLFLRGLASNYPSPLCLSVWDNEGKVAEVLYLDAHVTCATQWVEWRIPFSTLNTPRDVNLAKVRKMRIGLGDPQNATPGGTGRLYIDDIRVIKSPTAAPPAQATLLYPPDGAVDVSQRMALQWRAGQRARWHDVYFGADANAVASATPASADVYRGRQAKGWYTYALFDPGPLDFNQTCFWRIDEVNDLHPESPCQGPVWRFTTADYLVIDDFERYNYEEGQNTRLYETWLEDYGYWDPVVPVDIWPRLERVLPHGGWQAMAMDYNNVVEPQYHEYYLNFSWPDDWTVRGFDTLVLYVRGWTANVPAPLYVRVRDSAGKQATVVHPDPQVLLASEWLEWRIPLSQLEGVNVRKVKEIGIGVGDRSNPQPGGAGIVYIDDIRIVKSVP